MIELYFLQRLGRYSDQDPSIKLRFLTVPFVAMQITGPLLILAIFTADHKMLTLVFVSLIIVINFLILKAIFYNKREQQILKKKLIEDIGHSFQIYHTYPILKKEAANNIENTLETEQQQQQQKQKQRESSEVFTTAVAFQLKIQVK